MKECIILAGGFGTRLQHLLPNTPKCLAPIKKRAFIDYVLLNLVNEQFTHFVFSLGYLSAQVVEHLTSQFPDLDIDYVIEEKALGTGGGIRLALQQCKTANPVIINADTFFPIDFSKFFESFNALNPDVLIAGKQFQNPDRYGTIEYNNTYQVTGFNEKQKREQGLINGGIYMINKTKYLEQTQDISFSFETDVLEKHITTWNISVFIDPAFFIDIGVPDDYNWAQKMLDIQFAKKTWKSWTLFLDRDGTINTLIPFHYVTTYSEFEFIDGALDSLAVFSQIFKRIYVITNQQGIGKKIMSSDDLDLVHHNMQDDIKKHLGRIDDIFYCPHLVESHCNCRKPKPGMLLAAKAKYPEIDFRKSIMIGDDPKDIELGISLGLTTIWINKDDKVWPSKYNFAPHIICKSLIDTVPFFLDIKTRHV